MWAALFDNPIFRYELRRLLRGRRSGARPRAPLLLRSRLIGHAVAVLLLAATPYVGDALLRLGPTTIGGAERACAIAIIAVGMTAAALGGLLAAACQQIARERDRQTLEPLLLSGLTPADVVVGKAAAVWADCAPFLSVAFAVWCAVPLLPADVSLLSVQLAGQPRVLVLLCWADMLALSGACAFGGLALSARFRSCHAGGLAAVATALGAALAIGSLVNGPVFGQPIRIGTGSHIAVWAISTLVALGGYTLAQVWLDPTARHVELLLWSPRRVSSGRHWVLLLTTLLVGVLLAGALALVGPARSAMGSYQALRRGGVLDRANALMHRHDHAGALRVLDGALQGRPGHAARLLWYGKACCHFRMGGYREAAWAYEEFRHASWSPSDQAAAFADVAACSQKLGMRRQAAALYLRALQMARRPDAGRDWRADDRQRWLRWVGHELAILGKRPAACAALDLASRGPVPDLASNARQAAAILRERLGRAPLLGLRASVRRPDVIRSLTPGGPAERAGLQVGDRLLSVNGKPAPDRLHLLRVLARHRPGDTVTVTATRGTRTLLLQVRPTAPREPSP